MYVKNLKKLDTAKQDLVEKHMSIDQGVMPDDKIVATRSVKKDLSSMTSHKEKPYSIIEGGHTVRSRKLTGINFKLARPLVGTKDHPSLIEIKNGDKKKVSYSTNIGVSATILRASAIKQGQDIDISFTQTKPE